MDLREVEVDVQRVMKIARQTTKGESDHGGDDGDGGSSDDGGDDDDDDGDDSDDDDDDGGDDGNDTDDSNASILYNVLAPVVTLFPLDYHVIIIVIIDCIMQYFLFEYLTPSNPIPNRNILNP